MSSNERLGIKRVVSSHLRVVYRSRDELLESVVESAKRGEKRDFEPDMRDFLDLSGIRVKAELQEAHDPSKFLLVSPNHHSRNRGYSTLESLYLVATSSVAAYDLNLADKHTAWVIKKVDEPKIGPQQLERSVQNATITAYGTIPIRVEKKLVWNGLMPKIRDWFANRDEFRTQVAQNIANGNNIGYFPEQKPSRRLKEFHPAFPKFVADIQKGVGEFQMRPVAIFYEDNIARVNYGRVVRIMPDSDSVDVVQQTMLEISRNLPKKLQGKYS